MRYVFVLAVAVMLIGCSQGSSWSDDERTEFMEDCKSKLVASGESAENARVYCTCCLGELESQFETGQLAKRELTDEQMTVIEHRCAR